MKKLLYFVLGLVLIVIIAYFIILNLPQASVKNKAADFKMASTELFADFSKNENKANRMYNGKIIEVQGKLLDVSEDEQGATVLILESGDDFAGILCTLDNKPKKLPTTGQDLKIKGQCNGMLMDVVLSKCVIVTK